MWGRLLSYSFFSQKKARFSHCFALLLNEQVIDFLLGLLSKNDPSKKIATSSPLPPKDSQCIDPEIDLCGPPPGEKFRHANDVPATMHPDSFGGRRRIATVTSFHRHLLDKDSICCLFPLLCNFPLHHTAASHYFQGPVPQGASCIHLRPPFALPIFFGNGKPKQTEGANLSGLKIATDFS